ncbi:MAG: nucleoside kinase [Clostridium sp.]|nr:nucleoside kinase [Clostridium sp.]
MVKYLGKDYIIKNDYRYIDIVKNAEKKPILVKQGKEYFELCEKIKYDDKEIIPVFINDYVGHKSYERTLSFILYVAFKNIFKDKKLIIGHSLSRGLYCWSEDEHDFSKEEIGMVEKEMEKIVEGGHRIEKKVFTRKEYLNMALEKNKLDEYNLIKTSNLNMLQKYDLLGHFEYFYGKMAYDTSYITLFKLNKYKDGFVLNYPCIESTDKTFDFVPQDKLYEIFRETSKWNHLLGVSYVADLNRHIIEKETNVLVSVTEALHEKKIVNIADKINERKNIKVILIAGPSSSGKTSLANRLGIQLRVNGITPIAIGMDDYFVPRRLTPLKMDGTFDYESPNAIELELFEKDIKSLIDGKEVRTPTFNFRTGEREYITSPIKLTEKSVLIVEGIHGLNPRILSHIEDQFKFRIYVSPLTVLNLDSTSRIATSDVRKLRRIARDNISRGYSPEETLSMYDSVARGERKYIFPYQSMADEIFNSTLVYEMSVLKKHTMVELKKIDKKSAVYEEAKRLMTILNLFLDIEDDLVPKNSILREFIGGSQFYKY